METNVISAKNVQIFRDALRIRREAMNNLAMYNAAIDLAIKDVDFGDSRAVRVIQASDPSVIMFLNKQEDEKVSISVIMNRENLEPGVEYD